MNRGVVSFGHSRGTESYVAKEMDAKMATWLLILIIVLIVLALFGGVGYTRR